MNKKLRNLVSKMILNVVQFDSKIAIDIFIIKMRFCKENFLLKYLNSGRQGYV